MIIIVVFKEDIPQEGVCEFNLSIFIWIFVSIFSSWFGRGIYALKVGLTKNIVGK